MFYAPLVAHHCRVCLGIFRIREDALSSWIPKIPRHRRHWFTTKRRLQIWDISFEMTWNPSQKSFAREFSIIIQNTPESRGSLCNGTILLSAFKQTRTLSNARFQTQPQLRSNSPSPAPVIFFAWRGVANLAR